MPAEAAKEPVMNLARGTTPCSGLASVVTFLDERRSAARTSLPDGLYDDVLCALASIHCRFARDAELAQEQGEDETVALLLVALSKVRACIEETCLLGDTASRKLGPTVG
jgi:hypothetical protein